MTTNHETYVSYYAVTQYGNEYGNWITSDISSITDVEDAADSINQGRYDGKASITIISWQELK